MTTEISNTPDGQMIQVRVCQDNICKVGLVSSMHLVAPKANQLMEAIHAEAFSAYIPAPWDDPLA